MQWIERLMYAVDEWLRFKSGQGRLMMVLKGTLGTVWFFVAYGIRFCVNLLIEPQLNPVKHVPWVTVSHKILAPMWIAMDLHGLLAQHMNAAMADVMTFLIVTLTPGIFGYLIWELKENWRLFAANRSKTLDPAARRVAWRDRCRGCSGRGSTPARSPSVSPSSAAPSEKRLEADGDPQAVRKHREALHHVEIDLPPLPRAGVRRLVRCRSRLARSAARKWARSAWPRMRYPSRSTCRAYWMARWSWPSNWRVAGRICNFPARCVPNAFPNRRGRSSARQS